MTAWIYWPLYYWTACWQVDRNEFLKELPGAGRLVRSADGDAI